MKQYILKRVGKALLTIYAVYTLVFLLTRATGDPLEWLKVAGASESAMEMMRQSLGLDLPLWQQYLKSFVDFLHGDAGTSYYYQRAVLDLFGERIWYTLSLGGIVIAVTILIGIPLGVIAAVRHNTLADRLTMGTAIVGSTIPNFILGILLIFIFSLRLRLLPSSSTGTIRHYILPILTMAVGPTACIARLTRSSLLDVLGQDYMECARAKGMREWKVVIRHGLRNALIPIITIIGAQLSAIIGGSVVVETVFSWPGIGTLIVNSAQQRDFPVVGFGVLLIATSVTFVNLMVDLMYGVLDPRIRSV